MNKGFWILAVFGVVLLVGLMSKPPIVRFSEPSDTIDYFGKICVAYNNHPIGCYKNVLTNNGKDLIKDALGQGASVKVITLALGNGTAPTATDTALPGEYTTCGFGKTNGTYVDRGTGNWTITNTFTSTCAGVNVTNVGLYNATGNVFFAGTNITTIVVNNVGDQITINYTITVTEP